MVCHTSATNVRHAHYAISHRETKWNKKNTYDRHEYRPVIIQYIVIISIFLVVHHLCLSSILRSWDIQNIIIVNEQGCEGIMCIISSVVLRVKYKIEIKCRCPNEMVFDWYTELTRLLVSLIMPPMPLRAELSALQKSGWSFFIGILNWSRIFRINFITRSWIGCVRCRSALP